MAARPSTFAGHRIAVANGRYWHEAADPRYLLYFCSWGISGSDLNVDFGRD
jgi:hypothetical protein